MFSMSYECDICKCEYIRYINKDINNDGEIKTYHGSEGKKYIAMCSSCTSEILDYVERLREEYGFYEN